MGDNDIFNEGRQALKNFLLDIGCLDPLAEWTSEFNLFHILKIARAEIRHSNMLSWLLNPNENHGLNDRIIRGFIQHVVSSCNKDVDVFRTLLMDYYDFIIQREWKGIDILAVSDEQKLVLCIENKIDSGEHSNQLNRYRCSIEESYPDYEQMYVFLSPDGYESSDVENWCSMGYENVLDIIEKACRKTNLLPDASILIDNYIKMVRRVIVGDNDLERICKEIYAKHQKALDLIFENRPDRVSEVAEIFKEWAKRMTEEGEIQVVLDKCSKTYTRFKTKGTSEIFPDAKEPKSGWNTRNNYFYEIVNRSSNEFYIQLAFSSKNMSADLKDVCERIIERYSSGQQKENWQWRAPFKTAMVKIGDELSEGKIYEELNKGLDKIKAFEQEIISWLEQEAFRKEGSL